MKILLLSFALASVSSLADGTKTWVSFVDDCSDKELYMAPLDATDNTIPMGRTVSLRAQISGVKPNTVIWTKIEIGTATPETSKSSKNDIIERELHANSRGEIVIHEHIRLSKWRKQDHPVLLRARVLWAETKDAVHGGGGGSATMAIPNTRSSYNIRSGGVCLWESPISIVSEFKKNTSTSSEMTITRERALIDHVSKTFGIGIGFGNSNTFDMRSGNAGLTPGGGAVWGGRTVYPSDIPVGFWVFSGWWNTYAEVTTSALTQSWYLHGEDGGFMGERYTFQRFKGDEYSYERSGRCGGWNHKEEGYIDVGIPSVTFYSVPSYMAGDPEGAAAYMEKIRPGLNTCNDPEAGNRKFKVEDPSEGLMYFYPKH